MPIYWSYKSIPELAALSDVERNDIWHTASSRAHRRWETWASSVVIALFAAGGARRAFERELPWQYFARYFGRCDSDCVKRVEVDFSRRHRLLSPNDDDEGLRGKIA